VTGQIRRLNPATGISTPFFKVPDVASAGDQGLLGLALDPSYPGRSRVGVRHPRRVGNGDEPAPADPTRRQRLRGPAELPTAELRNGGRIMFGPDGSSTSLSGTPQPVQLPEPGRLGREGDAVERRWHGAIRQPTRRKRDHRLRLSQLLRVHIRPAERAPVGDRKRPGMQRRDQPRPRFKLTNFGWGRRRPAARHPRRRATPTGTGPARCCRGSSSPTLRR
jgi:hypothetical protein